MSRLEKKCYLGSAAFHGLLLVVLLCTAAFLPSKNNSDAPGPVVTMIAGPTGPAATARPDVTPKPPVAEPPQPKPEPPPPQPDPPKQAEPKPKEPHHEVAKDTEKDHGPLPVRVKPKEKEPPKEKKPAVASSKSSLTNLVKRPTVDNKAIQLAQAKRDQEARDAARDARELKAQRDRILSDVDGAIGGATSRLSKSGVAISPGQDFGGAAAAAAGQYGDSLKAIYDAKWTLKSDAYDDDTAASVRVIVRRDGSVVSATMTKPSGNAGFDRSVRAVLNDVTRVLPFPSEMKDAEREFTWRFVRRTRAG